MEIKNMKHQLEPLLAVGKAILATASYSQYAQYDRYQSAFPDSAAFRAVQMPARRRAGGWLLAEHLLGGRGAALPGGDVIVG